MLDDLLNAMEADRASPYFLGSVVLIKADDDSRSEIVDGQQRLTTLSMLMCVLRDLATDSVKKHLDAFVRESGNPLRGTADRVRLNLRRRDREFFRRNVQEPGAIESFLEADTKDFSDSQQLILRNVRELWNELTAQGATTRQDLGEFVIQQCYLVVVTATDRDSAHRIFSVMNDRGLDLQPTDILKAKTIGRLREEQQDEYGKKWEDIEADLGREAFRELFTHIRMINLKTKLRTTLQTDFQQKILPTTEAAAFVDEMLRNHTRTCISWLLEPDIRATRVPARLTPTFTTWDDWTTLIGYHRRWSISAGGQTTGKGC